MNEIYRKEAEPLGLAVIEWYILQTLYEQDGQMASQIARTVGRAPTSFTPILDQLEGKQLIERRPHPSDRRGVKLYLTKHGKALENQVQESAERLDKKLKDLFSAKEWQSYQNVIGNLQILAPEMT